MDEDAGDYGGFFNGGDDLTVIVTRIFPMSASGEFGAMQLRAIAHRAQARGTYVE
jgi:hypothetical protein